MTEATAAKPGTRKVAVGSIAGAAMTVIAYALSKNGISLPQEIFGAASTLLTAVFVYKTPETYS